MKVLIVIVILAAIGLLGVVTKSILALLLGAIGISISFFVFCTGLLLSILGKIIALVLGLAVIGAAILFVPVALIVIIPGICLAYLFARQNKTNGPSGEGQKRKAIVEIVR
jgi:hypothetical protein